MSTSKDPITPISVHPPFGNYSHGMKLSSFNTLVTTSGQLGISKDGAIPENVESQARICFENIDQILQDAGLSKADLIHLRTFVTARQYFQAYMGVRDQYLGGICIASTLVIVSGFTRPEFKVEIEALAAR